MSGNRQDVGRHHCLNRLIRVLCEKARQVKGPNIFIVPSDDIYGVCAVRNIAMCAKISQHDLDRNIRSNRDDVNVHQTAGAVLIISKNLTESLLILIVERT